MKILGIIPARYASTRFPGKPLTVINGKPMIQRVYEQAKKATSLTEVVVATDDERIKMAVLEFGGKVVMTSAKHKSGTERCREVLEKFRSTGKNFDIVVNIQGDEPYIAPQQIDLVVSCFDNSEVQIATLAKKINSKEELFNPNVNKVIINKFDNAVYFSRQTIPFIQNTEKNNWLTSYNFYKHIGIYAYRADVLIEITELEITSLEKAESLEQLRWIENDYKIKVIKTELESYAVDTPDDLLKFMNKS